MRPALFVLALSLVGCSSSSAPSSASPAPSDGLAVDCASLDAIIVAGRLAPDFASIRTDQQVPASGFFNNYAVTASMPGAERIYLQQQYDRSDSSRQQAVVTAEYAVRGMNPIVAGALLPTRVLPCLGTGWAQDGSTFTRDGYPTVSVQAAGQARDDGALNVTVSVTGPIYVD